MHAQTFTQHIFRSKELWSLRIHCSLIYKRILYRCVSQTLNTCSNLGDFNFWSEPYITDIHSFILMFFHYRKYIHNPATLNRKRMQFIALYVRFMCSWILVHELIFIQENDKETIFMKKLIRNRNNCLIHCICLH